MRQEAVQINVSEDRAAASLTLPGFSQAFAQVPRPFLRWAGGKTRLLKSILPYVPAHFTNYHEPFLGSGALFFATPRVRSRRFFLSDLNQELANIWTVIRDQPDRFLHALKPYETKNSEQEYYDVRESKALGAIDRAARFFYLNQTSWNGLWRVNKWGVFNVPWGARSFRGITAHQLHAVHAALQGVTIEHVDFRLALNEATRGDFVYLDPPYLPISDTSKFSGYTEQRFRIGDLVTLSEICAKLSARGVHWILSNRDNATVRKLFSGSKIVAFATRRSVAAQNKRDIEPYHSPEVLIIGKTK